MGAIFLQSRTKDSVYEWPTSTTKSSDLLAFLVVKTTSSEWHHRLGHPWSSIFKHIVSTFHLEVSNSCNTNFNCNACQCIKSHKLPFSFSTLTTTSLLKVIFYDVWTSPIHSVDDFKYYVIFVDHFTKYVWFYPIKRKPHLVDVFVWFKSLVENHFQSKIVTFYSDNEGEVPSIFHIFSHQWCVSPNLSSTYTCILSVVIAT